MTQSIPGIINISHDFLLVDTAGLRKKSKVSEDIEFYSVMRAVRTIENSDICLLMIDGTRGIEAQDLNIMSLILKNNKGMIILVNKWDLVEKETNTTKVPGKGDKKQNSSVYRLSYRLYFCNQ